MLMDFSGHNTLTKQNFCSLHYDLGKKNPSHFSEAISWSNLNQFLKSFIWSKTSCVSFFRNEESFSFENGIYLLDNISVKSRPILKNHIRFEIAKKIPTIWDLARLCSFICLKVMVKNMNGCIF